MRTPRSADLRGVEGNGAAAARGVLEQLPGGIARQGIRDGELRVARAVQGPRIDAPIRHTKNRSAEWRELWSDRLLRWIGWRLEHNPGEAALTRRAVVLVAASLGRGRALGGVAARRLQPLSRSAAISTAAVPRKPSLTS